MRQAIDGGGGTAESLITNDKVLKIVEVLAKEDYQISNNHNNNEDNINNGGGGGNSGMHGEEGDYSRQPLPQTPYTAEDEERMMQ